MSAETSTRFELEGAGGTRLVGEARGAPGAPPVLLLHGGGQTRHSWAGTASALASHGWRTITLDARGHGESDWSTTTDYRLTSFAEDVRAVVATLDESPFLIGASLGGLTSMLLAGELAPGIARGVVLVDIIPDMEQAGADRIQSFMAGHAHSGFGSLEEVADAIAAYNPHRPRPDDRHASALGRSQSALHAPAQRRLHQLSSRRSAIEGQADSMRSITRSNPAAPP